MHRVPALVSSLVVAATSLAAVLSAPAAAQVLAPQADYQGYSTGSILHAGVLRLGSTQLVDAELAFSGATIASQGTRGVTFGPGAAPGTVVNEYGQVVQPSLPDATDPARRGDRAFGRGSGLEVGLANNLPTTSNQIILAQKAQASAPPPAEVRREIGPLKLDGLAYASLVRGEAQARFREDRTCLPGQPLSSGVGYVADAQLLGTGGTSAQPFDNSLVALDSSSPERRVAQSRSTTQLVPQVDINGNRLGDNFGLMTETRQTIAPVTLFRGQPTQITIEFLGEWVLRAVATGVGGPAGNYIFYGPGRVTPQTPVLRILSGLAPPVENIVQITLQQLLGTAGLVVNLPGLAEIAVGEDPRGIGGSATSSPALNSDGTLAAAALDVVRVTLLDGTLADVRIGHMEARAQVPAGGIRCQLPITKAADRLVVNAGEQFTYTIEVTNPFGDCSLTNVRVVDTITVPTGLRYSVVRTSPQATVAGDVITFNDIGPIGPGSRGSATITIAIPPDSGGGLMVNNATATGVCATGTGNGQTRIQVPITGEVTVQFPQIGPGPVPPITPITPIAPPVAPPAPSPISLQVVPPPLPAPVPPTVLAAVPPPSELPRGESSPPPTLPRTGGSGPALVAGLLAGAALAVRRLAAHSRGGAAAVR